MKLKGTKLTIKPGDVIWVEVGDNTFQAQVLSTKALHWESGDEYTLELAAIVTDDAEVVRIH